MTHKNTLVSAIMITAIVLSIMVLQSYRPQPMSKAQIVALPDAFMEEVKTTVLDKNGEPSMKIISPKMVHYAQNDTTNLINPMLTLYHDAPQPWFITSKFAVATSGIDNVHFSQDVVIRHPGDEGSPVTIIKTPTLLVHTIQRTAETNALITLVQPNITVNAVGMFADLNAGDVKLLSQARGEYAPIS